MDLRALSNVITLGRMGLHAAVRDPSFSEANLAAMAADLAHVVGERDRLVEQERNQKAEKKVADPAPARE